MNTDVAFAQLLAPKDTILSFRVLDEKEEN